MAPTGNSLLDSLPPEELAIVQGGLRRAELPRGTALFEYGDELEYLDFPLAPLVVSLTTQTADGNPIEVSMVGAEGILGCWVLADVWWSPWFAVAQVGGAALRWPIGEVRRVLPRTPVLQGRLQQYGLMQTFLMSQSVLCNRFHDLAQRTARWLLILSAKSRAVPLPVTQEFLSQMLGVHRPSVTLALQGLAEAGLIQNEGRGLIRIVNLEGLGATACECFGQVLNFNRAVMGEAADAV